MTSRSAWDVLVELLADERIDFWPEPSGFHELFPRLLRYNVPTQALVSDAYLAAFAICRESAVVTLDGGFQQFAGLSVELLESR